MNDKPEALSTEWPNRQLQSLFDSVFGHARDAIMITDSFTTIVRVNPAFTEITGYSAQEAIGRKPNLLKSDEQEPGFYVRMWAAIHKDGEWQGEIRNRRANGEHYSQWLSIASIKDERGAVQHYVGMFSDLTERKMTSAQLRLHARVFSQAGEGIMITDKELRILAVNRAFVAMTGYSEEETLGHTPRMLHSGVQDKCFYIRMWEQIHATGAWQGEIWNRKKNGDVYPEWLSISTLRDEQGSITHYVGMFFDITRSKQSEARLKHLAHYDKLTELPNRTLLGERFGELTRTAGSAGRPLALLFIDLDRFKMVNDSLGHATGDRLLKQVAHRLVSAVGSDDVVSRPGGDEFIVVLTNAAEQGRAERIAAGLIARLKEPYDVEGNEVYIGASIGISLYPEHGDSFEMLVRYADWAMYQAKRHSEEYQLFNAGISSAYERKLSLEHELRWAIERGQLYLEYQPQLDVATGSLQGMEALLRWNHPVHGSVPPGEFIPVAEDTGLIKELGCWVLREACRQLNRWTAAGFDVPSIAVNMSARQFLSSDLLPSVRAILRETGISPHRLVIEITESGSMFEVESVMPVLHAFKGLGLRIAIDDFGKGYSALGYMRHFPIDLLKIDKSFIREIAGDPTSAVITKAIIDMAHGLNLKVIAEGMETADQLACLLTMGCDMVQGFGIDRPMSPERLAVRYGGVGMK